MESFEFEAEVATIVFEEETNQEQEKLQQWEFKTPTVNRRGETIKTTTHSASYFTETLTESIGLEMVAIPGGTFTMGSPENEKIHPIKSQLFEAKHGAYIQQVHPQFE